MFIMINANFTNYSGMMPDELPHGLCDTDLCQSIEAFAEYGGKDLYVTWSGGLSKLGCIKKVFMYALYFFGLSNALKTENIQYQFLKILSLANRRDLIKDGVEKALSECKIEGLLIGVSEAIENRDNLDRLRSSLFKFSKNHEVKPPLFARLLTPTLPANLYMSDDDFGITYLHYASQTSGFCTSIIEPLIQSALICVEIGHHPSAAFCIKFVEVVRKYPKAFETVVLDKDEQGKIDMILHGAFVAFSNENRNPEAVASIVELRERLLDEQEVSQVNLVRLALLHKFFDLGKAEEYLNECDFENLEFLNHLTHKDRNTFILFLLQYVKEHFSYALFLDKKINLILLDHLKRLTKEYPKELAEVLTQFCQHSYREEMSDLQAQSTEEGFVKAIQNWAEGSESSTNADVAHKISPKILSRAMEHFANSLGEESTEAIQMAENLGLLLENTPEVNYRTTLINFSEGLPRARILGQILLRNLFTKDIGEKIMGIIRPSPSMHVFRDSNS